MRGRYESEGEYTVSAADRNDGFDTIEWLTKQSWNTGKVGIYGCSYLGENQIQLAAMRHPNHTTAIAQSAAGGYRGTNRPFGLFDGGVPELASGLGWFWSQGSKQFWGRPPNMSDEDFRRYAELYQSWPSVKELDFQQAFEHLPVVDIINHYGGPKTDFENFYSKVPYDPY